MFWKQKKKRAVAYIDFEHWCISMHSLYGGKPNVKAWRDMVAEKYDLRDIYVFGDFSNPILRSQLSELREITSSIIETQSAEDHSEKDYTDFIMLDQIYQQSLRRKKEKVFLIFSGDGHFSSVVSYLVNKCKKQVCVYGIKGAFSAQLKNCASEFTEMPTAAELQIRYYQAIYRRINELYAERKSASPTFRATAASVAATMGTDTETISLAMSEMIAKGYLYQSPKYVGQGKSIKVLRIDHEKAAASGFFN